MASFRTGIGIPNWNWDTIEHFDGVDTSLSFVSGVVLRVFRDMFPDPSYNPEDSKWTLTKPPPAK